MERRGLSAYCPFLLLQLVRKCDTGGTRNTRTPVRGISALLGFREVGDAHREATLTCFPASSTNLTRRHPYERGRFLDFRTRTTSLLAVPRHLEPNNNGEAFSLESTSWRGRGVSASATWCGVSASTTRRLQSLPRPSKR